MARNNPTEPAYTMNDVIAQQDRRQYKSGRIDNNYLNNNGIKKDKVELKKELDRRYARDCELVVIQFKNLETPGGVLRFSYKRWARDQWEKYELFDGQVYQIKRGVRDHISKGCYSLVYQQLQGAGAEGSFAIQAAGMHNEYSHKVMTASKKLHRFQALGLEYMDDSLDYNAPEIHQVSISPA